MGLVGYGGSGYITYVYYSVTSLQPRGDITMMIQEQQHTDLKFIAQTTSQVLRALPDNRRKE